MNLNEIMSWAEIDIAEVIAAGGANVTSSEELHALTKRVAEHEVRKHWGMLGCKIIAFAEREGEDAEQLIRKEITDALVSGADDTWSGRGNDLQRIRHDALREIARKIL